MKNILGIKKLTRFVILLLVVFAIIFIGVISIPHSVDTSSAAVSYVGYEVKDNYFYVDEASTQAFKSDLYVDPLTSIDYERRYFNLDYDNWISTLAPGLYFTMLYNYTEGSGADSTPASSEFNIYLSEVAGGSNTTYAYITDMQLTGTTWNGISFNGSKNNLFLGGVYHIESITVSYYIGEPCQTHRDQINAGDLSAGTVPYATGSVVLQFADSGDNAFDLLIKAKLMIDDSQANLIGIDNNLNISKEARTYNGNNLRNIVSLHSTSPSSSTAFSYSTKLSNTYNISNSDNKFFKSFSNNGIGNYDEQTTNLEGTYTNTTLIGIQNYLQLNWYTGFLSNGEMKYTKVEGNIISSEDYYLKICSGYSFEQGYEPLSVIMYSTGAEYVQSFKIEKKKLNIDLENPIGFTLKMTKNFDASNNAETLFSKKGIDSVDWAALGGLEDEYNTVQTVLSTGELFSFSNTVFDSSEIGTRLLHLFVTIKVDYSENASTINGILENYQPVVGRYVSEDFNSYETIIDETYGEYFLISTIGTNEFKILPMNMSISFNYNDFGATFLYGDYSHASKIEYSKYVNGEYKFYINVDNTTKNVSTGEISINNLSNWKVIYIADKASMVSSITDNILYIVPKTCLKIEDGEEYTSIFTDVNGNRYFDFSDRLWAKDYYVYYEIYVYFTDNSLKQVTQNATTLDYHVPKASNSTDDLLVFVIPELSTISILHKEIEISVNSCVLEKNYDGTTAVTEFVADTDSIISLDSEYVELAYNVNYNYAGAGSNIPINVEYYLKSKIDGQDISNIAASYTINDSNVINNTSYDMIDKGTINKLDLTVSFIEINYTKKYNEDIYVIVRVAKEGDQTVSGAILERDLYYFSKDTVDNYVKSDCGYCTEEELFSKGIINYVKLEVSGFLAGEGFMWDVTNSDLLDFMSDMTSGTPASQYLSASGFLTWYDTNKGVDIKRSTSASATVDDKYRLELSETSTLIPNYKMVVTGDSAKKYGYLLIEKLDLEADVVVVTPESGDNYMIYNGIAQLESIFTLGRVKLNDHNEFSEISATYPNLSELLTVTDFQFSCTNDEHNHSSYNLNSYYVKNMIYAGVYNFNLVVPATTNYMSLTVPFTIELHSKDVKVYLTKAVCIYGETDTIVYNTEEPKYISNIENYKRYIDSNGEYTVNGGNLVYVYVEDGEIVEGFFVMYEGFVNNEYIGSDIDADSFAEVFINPNYVDAGDHNSAITTNGASKHNYNFLYTNTTLHILRKPLEITADAVQSKVYTGEQIVPDHIISGGSGYISMYIAKKTINGVITENSEQTDTDVVDVGIYELKVFARPYDELNYKVNDVAIDVALTIEKRKLIAKDGVYSDEKNYDGEIFELKQFDEYFAGAAVAPEISNVSSRHDWGYVYVSAATKDSVPVEDFLLAGENVYVTDSKGNLILDILGYNVPVLNILESGTYILTVIAIISNTSNVYFDDSGSEVFNYSFEIELEINKSQNMAFSVNTTEGMYFSEDESGTFDGLYTLIYNGMEAQFDYSLIVAGIDMSDGEISVTSSLNGVLYSYNNNLYMRNDAVYNTNAALSIIDKIPSIDYNIMNRRVIKNVTGENTHELKFYINNENSTNYNSNFASYVKTYKIVVNKAQLKVYITFEEGYRAEKIYMGSNAEAESHVRYMYTGWINDEGSDELILSEIVLPTIDWSEVAEDAVAGMYQIWSKDGTAPSNYYFDHSFSNITFEVLKAESWIIVYGSYDAESDIYYDYLTYTGQKQTPLIQRMSGDSPITAPEDVIGQDGITLKFEGSFVGDNKDLILPKDIDRTVESCLNVGKYVFSLSVIASTNYRAVPKAYYYYEIVKADLDIVFVKETNIGDEYYVTEVAGYATKIYDGESGNFPSFSVQYKGFVGKDDTDVNKNIIYVKYVSDIVYVIVGENVFKSFSDNFVSVTDGQGTYIKDSQGNYVMLYADGNYIRDVDGNYIAVGNIVPNYYLSDNDYTILNGNYIKNFENEYIAINSINGDYVHLENNTFVLKNELIGKYAVTNTGYYYEIDNTYMLLEGNVYKNILDITAKYFKDETGLLIDVASVEGTYIKDYNGNYYAINGIEGNYNLIEDEYIVVEYGEGAYIRDENGIYIAIENIEGNYVKDFDGNYIELANLTAVYVKDSYGRAVKVSDIEIGNYIRSENSSYEQVTFATDEYDELMKFVKDYSGVYQNIKIPNATHIKDENGLFVKVKPYRSEKVTIIAPYVKIDSESFVLFNTLSPEYVKGYDGIYYMVNSAPYNYIRNAVGDYIDVNSVLGDNVKDENGTIIVVSSDSGKYFRDFTGSYLKSTELAPMYATTADGYIRVVGDYVCLENSVYINYNDIVPNYICDENGTYIKIKNENGNILTDVYGNYDLDSNGNYIENLNGHGSYVKTEGGEFIRVNANYKFIYYGISDIGLINPVYEIFNGDDGFVPIDVDIYNARILISGDDNYGVAKNYNLIIKYKQNEDVIAYPQLEITPRPIDIVRSDIAVTKVYDAYDRIPEGTINPSHYIFTKIKNNNVEVANSGIVGSDVVHLNYDAFLSVFSRSNVLDENGEASQIYVKIYGFSIDNGNYILQASELLSDEYGWYFQLYGRITPATATIKFADEFGNTVTTKLDIVYDSNPHSVYPDVTGVVLDNGDYESVSYDLVYICENSNYNSDMAPKNAEMYIAMLTVNANNYVYTQKSVDLNILKAEVEVWFGGDIKQTYGSVISGLSAEAHGVGNYLQLLTVKYYDADNNIVEDIIRASAGTYTARAIHYESTNFSEKQAEEIFIINKRPMSLHMDIMAEYKYTGKEVAPTLYFDYEGIRYTPELYFNHLVSNDNGVEDVPYNYEQFGDTPGIYPAKVGDYRLYVANNMQNFDIVDLFWINFSITPIALTVKVEDSIAIVGREYSLSFALEGNVATDTVNTIFNNKPQIRYYKASTNEIVGEQPNIAGIYKVLPYGGEADNYILNYKYGILTLNNGRLIASSSEENAEAVVVDGSFASELSLNSRELKNKNYSAYATIYDIYRQNISELTDYNIAKIFYINLSDGSVVSSDGSGFSIRIYYPELFNSVDVAAQALESAALEYKVASINANGDVKIISATRDGDYLCFSTDSLGAFCILTNEKISEDKNDMWILYVSIAVGVVMLAIALIIVKKRA